MSQTHAGTELWGRAYQVGVVVNDLQKAIAFYESFGVGPFVEGPSAHALERVIHGEPMPDAKVRGAITQIGSIEFELMQPVSGRSVQRQFLDEQGEGVVHICGHTDDLARDIDEMRRRGFEVVSRAELADGGRFAYFDTRAHGGVIFELFQPGGTWR
jgi:4-hydroxyphenylpyruvate dioxygenase-like putative hemolysin